MINKKIFKINIILISSLFFVMLTNSHAESVIQAENQEEYDEYEYNFEEYEKDITEYEGNYSQHEKKVEIWDPLEPINREIHDFNFLFLKYGVKPFYYNFYTKVTTENMRKGVSNIVNNFKMPWNFVNYVLQLDFRNASASLYSFLINSTIGLGGIMDVAGYQKIFVSNTDFGLTLARYNVPSGPYLVLPFFGPSNLRNFTAFGLVTIVDPLGSNFLEFGREGKILEEWILSTRTALFVVDSSSFALTSFYDMMENSFDSYTLMKHGYSQVQQFRIMKKRGAI